MALERKKAMISSRRSGLTNLICRLRYRSTTDHWVWMTTLHPMQMFRHIYKLPWLSQSPHSQLNEKSQDHRVILQRKQMIGIQENLKSPKLPRILSSLQLWTRLELIETQATIEHPTWMLHTAMALVQVNSWRVWWIHTMLATCSSMRTSTGSTLTRQKIKLRIQTRLLSRPIWKSLKEVKSMIAAVIVEAPSKVQVTADLGAEECVLPARNSSNAVKELVKALRAWP